METSFGLMLWRDSLAQAAPVPGASDLAEWADVLAAAGFDPGAGLLRDVAGLHGTVSRASSSPRSSAPRSTLGQAQDELRSLATLIATGGSPSDDPDGTSGPAVPDDIGEVARRLRLTLEHPLADDATPLRRLLASLVEAGRRLPAQDYRTFARAPLDLLVPAIASAGLIDWALATRDLGSGPLGSPLLLHRTAALDRAGFGPYLTNVGLLVRDAADVFALAEIAAAAGGASDHAMVEAWAALLSRGCRGGLLREIVDELGDRGAGDALSAILERVASRPAAPESMGMVMRIRDAALDNADYRLAARAQRVVTRSRPDDKVEAVILGTIEASDGAFGRATAIFRRWLGRPPDHDLRARCLAAEMGRLNEFRILHGFGSPADRRATRLWRRGVAPDYPRWRGERIAAVDVR